MGIVEDKRPHIVHILGTLGMGGAQSMVLRMITSTQLQAYRHSVICILGRKGENIPFYEAEKIPVHSCPLRWPDFPLLPSYRANRWLRNHLFFTFPHRLASLLKTIQADLVHTHVTTMVGLQSKAVIQIDKLPWIWTVHGLYRSRGEDVSDWRRTLQLVNRSTAAITAVSQVALDEVSSEADIAPEKVQVIPNGIDTAKYKSFVSCNPSWRTRLGIPNGAVIFGSAGRLINLKRYDVFIDAATEILKCGVNAHFFIAGDGPLRGYLEDKIRQIQIESNFHLLGYQADIMQFLSDIDVMVLPSETEGFPNVLIEAVAMKVPCIATAVGSVPEILQNGAGLIVQPGSVTELACAMTHMINPEVRDLYASRTEAVAERYSIDRICGKYDRLYTKLFTDQ